MFLALFYSTKVTKILRICAAYLWSMGFALVGFDYLYILKLQSTDIHIVYLFFLFASLACWWAEIREFGIRVVLYRLHDIATQAPWHFLLLYFLWVNLFAPFSEIPIQSVIYACGGWFSFIAIGFSAQLIFCERNPRGIILIPKFLKIAFWFYNFAVLLLSYSTIIESVWRNKIEMPLFSRDPIDLSLYLCIGLPFIIWDFAHPKRHMVPRLITGLSTMGIIISLFLLQQKYLIIAALCGPLSLLVLGVYKRIRVHRALAYLLFLCLLGINLVFVYSQNTLRSALVAKQEILWLKVWQSLKATHFLGAGIGSSIIGTSSIERGIWVKIFLEVGIIGILLYGLFFLSLLKNLFFIRRADQIVISNIAFISVIVFLLIASHFAKNPYSASIWVWYALWAVFASSRFKKDIVI